MVMKEMLYNEDDAYDIILNIDVKYSSLEDFQETNKRAIFLNFIEIFRKMTVIEKPIISLCIIWNTDVIVMKTTYQIDKSDINILNEILLPYFLDIEDYETCSEIKILYEKLYESKQ